MNTDNPLPEVNSNLESESEAPNSDGAQVEQSKSYMTWLLGIIASIIIFDQLTKRWALETLNDVPGKSISVIDDFLRWTLVYNEGGAMGTNIGGSTLYGVIGVVILLALGYYLWNYRHVGKIAFPLALIAGGAIGNLIDRFQMGKVVDWIDVDFFDIAIMGFRLERWWTFNIADSAISVALVYMLWQSFRPSAFDTAFNKADADTEAIASEKVVEAGEDNEKPQE